MDKRREGGSDYQIFRRISCLTVPKNSKGEPFSVSLISGIEKFYASEGYVTIFCRKIFCLTVPKQFVEEPFCAVFQKISGSRGGGEYQDFPSKIFCLSAEKFRRGNFVLLQKFPLAKKFMDKRGRGVSRFSVEFFFSQCRKISQRNLSVLCFRNFR